MDTLLRAKRIADLHVLYGQNEVVEELIRAGKIDEEYMYPLSIPKTKFSSGGWYRLTWHEN